MAVIEVIGNAGDEAELKFIEGAKGGFATAKFSLAETPREFKNGEWHQGMTIWWKVTVSGELAEWCADQQLKGMKLLVKGDLRHYEYKTKDGETKSGMEIKAKLVAQIGTLRRKSAKEQEENIEW